MIKSIILGDYIEQVSDRNVDLAVKKLMGINMAKEFFPSVANVIGTDMTKYRVVSKGQFAYNPMHVGRDHLVPIGLWLDDEKVLVSPAYNVFKITKPKALLPQYLMIWLRHSDFDRRAWFTTDNSVRGGFSWDSLCNMQLPLPEKKAQAMICMEPILQKKRALVAHTENIIDSFELD